MGRFARLGNDLYSARRSIEFIGRRRIWYSVAAVMIVGSLLSLALRGLNPGIEFRGGSEFTVSQVKNASELTGQDAVASVVPGAEARVSVLSSIGSDTKSIRVQTEKLTDEETNQVTEALAEAYDVPATNISPSYVGPSWGSDVTRKALQGLIVFLLFVAAVIAAYFRTWKMAAAGLVALLHDLIITVGVYSLVGFEVTPASVIGFLTILGYSLYDTVVVFDKVRENTEHITATTRRTYAEAANLAVNQTLVRSINTSVVALLPVASILFIGSFVLGAGTLKDISLALFVGIAAGTYSSIFVATPLLVDLRRREPELAAQADRVRRRREETASREAEPVPVPAGLPVGEDDETEDMPARGPATAGAGRSASSAASSASSAGSAGGQRQQPRRANRGRSGGRR